MFDRFFKSTKSSSSELTRVEEYKRYRQATKDIHHAAIDFIGDDAPLKQAAKALGMKGKGRQIIFDNEDEMSVLMDYMLHECRTQGKSVMERYQEEVGPQNQLEEIALPVVVSASTSLFEEVSVDRNEYTLHLKDLVNAGNDLALMDINFSQRAVPGLVFFVRPFIFEAFSMTSGIAFVFPPSEKQQLRRRAHSPKLKGQTPPIAARRYRTFFKLSKRRGFEVQYAED